MPGELDSHHVVDLALVPIRGRPDIGDGRNGAFIFGDAQLKPEMNRESHRVKLVNDRETRLVTEVIDARDIEEVIERELVFAELRHLAQVARRNSEGYFAAKLRFLLDLRPQKFA